MPSHSIPSVGRFTDRGGYLPFSRGTAGALHVFAHRCLDEREPLLGARALGSFLRHRPATDSRSVHLHWHLLVTEVAMGRGNDARVRFFDQILPWVTMGMARTDGPSALWHLALDAPDRSASLPWGPLARVARAHLAEPVAFLAAHDALALAGARDERALDAWIAAHGDADAWLVAFGRGLRALATGCPGRAEALFGAAGEGVEQLGGSCAQRSLFERITRLDGDFFARCARPTAQNGSSSGATTVDQIRA